MSLNDYERGVQNERERIRRAVDGDRIGCVGTLIFLVVLYVLWEIFKAVVPLG
jgi:hypothetical protein